MRRRRSPLIPAALACLLVLPACGARLDDDLRQQAADAALSRTGGAAGPGDPLATGEDPAVRPGEQSRAPGAPGAGGPAVGPGGTTGPVAGSGGGGGGVRPGGGGGAPAPPGGNGGATDVGVTGTEIVLGNVSDLSGPVPGLFQGAVIGTQAYIAKVNSEGGVFGRKLRLKVGDGQLECGQNKAQHQALAPKVFAFVGSFSLYDDCGADVLGAQKGVPDIHNALGQRAVKLANNFSIAPLPTGWRTGPLQYYKDKFPDGFKNVGSIYANAGGGAATWAGTKKAIASLGGRVVYERGFQPTDTDFTADIVRMRQDGVRMIYIVASDAPTFARILRAARAQNVDWPIAAGAIAYDEGFLKQAGNDANGVLNDQQFALFFNADEAGRIPAVREFQTWTQRVAPGEKRDLFGVFGWSSTELFVQALKAAGPRATRADVMAQLRRITRFDAGGLIAPANPAGKRPPTCWNLTKVVDGRFVRLDTPPTQYRCDGSYFYA